MTVLPRSTEMIHLALAADQELVGTRTKVGGGPVVSQFDFTPFQIVFYLFQGYEGIL